MKFPKKTRTYCPKCNKHTVHDIDLVKKKPRGSMKHGQRIFKRKMLGYGSFPREKPEGREKSSRRVDLRYKCTVCGKKHLHGGGWRAKKFELVKV